MMKHLIPSPARRTFEAAKRLRTPVSALLLAALLSAAASSATSAPVEIDLARTGGAVRP